MYSPYLRGKQFELLALREIAAELNEQEKGRLLPIIEPVKRSIRDAVTAFGAMRDGGLKFSVILNPSNGDFQRGDRHYYDLVRDALPANEEFWIPAYVLQDSEEDILGSIRNYGFSHIVAILPKNQEADKWQAFLANDFVQYIVVCNADSSSVYRRVSTLGKRLIRLDDCFQAEAKNANYRGKEEQFFNDKQSDYADRWYGFADFTTLPSSFIEGGLTPYVVAIHFTYHKDEYELWIHHFLSDSNPKGPENVQGKFFEAAAKVIPFFEGKDESSSPYIQAIGRYVEQQHYPGLGMLKKLSMKHHIAMMSRI